MSKKQLEEATPAYGAYVKLKLAPKNTPLFDRTPNGDVIVNAGEVFCRMPGKGRRMCGAKCAKDQDHLPYHMELVHGGADKGALRGYMPRRKKGKLNEYEVDMLKDFYENILMKDEDWPGKPMSRKRKASEELSDRPTSPTNDSDQTRKRYKADEIGTLEEEELRVERELFRIQCRLAVSRQRKAAQEVE